MASYYYLISSLPTLNADGEMPLTYEEFLQNCQGNVSEDTFKRLESLSLSSSEGSLLKDLRNADERVEFTKKHGPRQTLSGRIR